MIRFLIICHLRHSVPDPLDSSLSDQLDHSGVNPHDALRRHRCPAHHYQGTFRSSHLPLGVNSYIGEEHVPKDQAVLYIGNHRSFFDIVLTTRYSDLTGLHREGDSACTLLSSG